MFTFRLEALLTLRRRQRDEIQRQCAEPLRAALEEEARLAEELRRVAAALERERGATEGAVRPGELDIDRLLAGQRYQLVLRWEQARLAEQHRQAGVQVEGFRQRLRQAEQGVRVLEKLREKQWAEYREAEAARDLRRLDEVAIDRAARARREESA